MKRFKKYFIAVIPLILLITSGILLIGRAESNEEIIITGMAEATHIDIASKIAGRIDSILVNEGENVQKGQTIAIIRSKEIEAKLDQVKSVMDAAYSKLQMAINGARPEEKEMAEKLYLQSKYQYELTETTYSRFVKLYNDSLISALEKDKIEFQYKSAREQMEAARAKYEMVLKGARNEEILMAEANYRQAENSFREVLAYEEELSIISPISGELSKKITDRGEIVAAGYPVFMVTDLNDIWVTIQVREDRMQNFRKDAVFQGRIPAFGNKNFEFYVSYISAMGDFAVWKPTNQKGDFDLKTFEVRLRPKGRIEGFRPGMSVNIVMSNGS